MRAGLGDVVAFVNFCFEGHGRLRSVVREFGGSVVRQETKAFDRSAGRRFGITQERSVVREFGDSVVLQPEAFGSSRVRLFGNLPKSVR